MEDNNNFNIEEAFTRLDQIVRALESQGTSLTDSMKLYAEGVELSKKCKDNLEDVEKEIQILTVKEEDE